MLIFTYIYIIFPNLIYIDIGKYLNEIASIKVLRKVFKEWA
jgi:hypothetical protein